MEVSFIFSNIFIIIIIIIIYFAEDDLLELIPVANLPLFVCEPPPQHGHWEIGGVGLHLGTKPGLLKGSTLNLTTRPPGVALFIISKNIKEYYKLKGAL